MGPIHYQNRNKPNLFRSLQTEGGIIANGCWQRDWISSNVFWLVVRSTKNDCTTKSSFIAYIKHFERKHVNTVHRQTYLATFLLFPDRTPEREKMFLWFSLFWDILGNSSIIDDDNNNGNKEKKKKKKKLVFAKMVGWGHCFTWKWGWNALSTC